MKTHSGQEETILTEREYALASAKLIQQFQRILILVKGKIMPSFEVDESQQNGGLSSIMSFFASLIGSDTDTQQEQQRREVARDKQLLAELRHEL